MWSFSEGEWLVYDIFCLEDSAYTCEVLLKGMSDSSEISFELNGKALETEKANLERSTSNVSDLHFVEGQNTFNALVSAGTVAIENFEFLYGSE